MIRENLTRIYSELPSGVQLVAVSKFHPVQDILEAYGAGQRVFGENRPQEFAAKAAALPEDIAWHFIGHLQTNKLKLVLPRVSLLQSVDSVHLLEAVNAWALENGRVIDILLELHLGAEQTKHGLTEQEIRGILAASWPGVRIRGLMGMATHTEDEALIRADFARISTLLKELRQDYPFLEELSIGMSGDWRLAVEYGATLVRIGTAIFGER
ncbi:MAG: YggS family pyridoxal phosphate-dependent enzyme [Bacteroidales bacterium]|nr:YggS family pyridoxal phosphate-dependent enzyme [Bacteroidales bacterium]